MEKDQYHLQETESSSDDENANQDGEWVIIQEWGPCSLTCGGGKSYLQRLCKPPKGNGKPCEGDTVLEKPCNTHACPIPYTDEKDEKIEKLKPIYKDMRVSDRFQRFEMCVIKEEELDLNFINPADGTNQRFTVRVAMNNKTISIFT